MNEKEKTILIFLIIALSSAVVINLIKRWKMSNEMLKILPKEMMDTTKLTAERKEEEININQATLQELISLPGIGPVLAERIIEYRERHKGFKKKEEIMKVKGIGRKKYEEIKEKIRIR